MLDDYMHILSDFSDECMEKLTPEEIVKIINGSFYCDKCEYARTYKCRVVSYRLQKAGINEEDRNILFEWPNPTTDDQKLAVIKKYLPDIDQKEK